MVASTSVLCSKVKAPQGAPTRRPVDSVYVASNACIRLRRHDRFEASLGNEVPKPGRVRSGGRPIHVHQAGHVRITLASRRSTRGSVATRRCRGSSTRCYHHLVLGLSRGITTSRTSYRSINALGCQFAPSCRHLFCRVTRPERRDEQRAGGCLVSGAESIGFSTRLGPAQRPVGPSAGPLRVSVVVRGGGLWPSARVPPGVGLWGRGWV